jgi:FMN phosphatase YigB (HAD superfamily)
MQELFILSRITTVTFDLWQTLLLDNRELGRVRTQVRLEGAQKVLKRFGEEYDLEHLREAYRSCYRHCRDVRAQNLDVTFEEQVKIFIDNIDPGLVDRLPQELVQEIVAAYSDAFFVHPPLAHADAFHVLSQARAAGLRIGLISNTGMTPGVAFRRFLDQNSLLGFFDTLTFSDEVKMAKPGREIFLMTLREMGSEPSETVHVGDHVKNDVEGANLAGMRTVWIEGFYEKPADAGPEANADASVAQLGMVTEAIREIRQR